MYPLVALIFWFILAFPKDLTEVLTSLLSGVER